MNFAKAALDATLFELHDPYAAMAAASDYVFEPVNAEVRNGPGSEIAVRHS